MRMLRPIIGQNRKDRIKSIAFVGLQLALSGKSYTVIDAVIRLCRVYSQAVNQEFCDGNPEKDKNCGEG